MTRTLCILAAYYLSFGSSFQSCNYVLAQSGEHSDQPAKNLGLTGVYAYSLRFEFADGKIETEVFQTNAKSPSDAASYANNKLAVRSQQLTSQGRTVKRSSASLVEAPPAKTEPSTPETLDNFRIKLWCDGQLREGGPSDWVGTKGASNRVMWFLIEGQFAAGVNVQYDCHFAYDGWKGFCNAGNKAEGSSGNGLRVFGERITGREDSFLQAVRIRLTGPDAAKYTVKYRSHVQDKGDETAWRRDGEVSGTVGEHRRIEAIQVVIEEK